MLCVECIVVVCSVFLLCVVLKGCVLFVLCCGLVVLDVCCFCLLVMCCCWSCCFCWLSVVIYCVLWFDDARCLCLWLLIVVVFVVQCECCVVYGLGVCCLLLSDCRLFVRCVWLVDGCWLCVV